MYLYSNNRTSYPGNFDICDTNIQEIVTSKYINVPLYGIYYVYY
jgi:hypothetical protein